MSRATVLLVSIVIAGLCLLALDDITTGNEPGYALEWTMVAATACWFGGLTWRRLKGREG